MGNEPGSGVAVGAPAVMEAGATRKFPPEISSSRLKFRSFGLTLYRSYVTTMSPVIVPTALGSMAKLPHAGHADIVKWLRNRAGFRRRADHEELLAGKIGVGSKAGIGEEAAIRQIGTGGRAELLSL